MPFRAEGNLATAGGRLASQYLATWMITRTRGEAAARDLLDYVAPVGENQQTVALFGPTVRSSATGRNRSLTISDQQ